MDKFFRNRTTGEPVTREDLMEGRPNRSLPLKLRQSTLDNLNLDLVQPTDKPEDTPLETYSWVAVEDGSGGFKQEWVPQYTLADEALVEPLRSHLIKVVSKKHKEKRDGGCIFDGFAVGTDVTARAFMVADDTVGLKRVVIKGVPREFSSSKYRKLKERVNKYVLDCDQREFDLVKKIVESTTIKELESVKDEVNKGWPL